MILERESGLNVGRENESLFAASGSHDQADHHAHICYYPFRKSSPEPVDRAIYIKQCMYHHGLAPIIFCSNDDPR